MDPARKAVSNGSKVQIWKQITTVPVLAKDEEMLFPMVQRYKFESKSQRETNQNYCINAVSNGSKVQIWKQITTYAGKRHFRKELFPMVQRYKFESKSQLENYGLGTQICCFQWFKGTNLKANHNQDYNVERKWQLFPMVQRYKFESKSQPGWRNGVPLGSCFQWFKGTNLKANHNVE